MPAHFIQLVSESFRRKTKKTAERKSIFAECLDENGSFLKKRSVHTIKMMRDKGYDGKMDQDTAYYEKSILTKARDYFWGTSQQREEIESHRHQHKNGEYLGVNCLLADGFQTREDIETKMRELAPPPPEQEAPTEAAKGSTTFPTDDLPEINTQEGNGRIAAISALLTPVKSMFVELIQENSALRDEIAKLGRERAFLNRLLSEYRARLHGAVIMDDKLLADAEEIARELDNTAWARTNRLALRTNPEKWHGQSMEIIYAPVMRENFESKHWTTERKRTRDHLNRYAQEGWGHPSFYSKVFDTKKGDHRLAGVPEDTERYWYNRVSDGIRFYAEIKEEKLFIYNIEPKESIF